MADLGSTLVDAFVRDNRVLPPVLAVLALFIIAWILAGAFMGEPDQETVAHKADLAQIRPRPIRRRQSPAAIPPPASKTAT